jgi:RNA polymerase sigma-70 factor (ECF subfamily)
MTEEAEMSQEFDDKTEEMLQKMEDTIETFPPRQREIFKASRFQQMTYKEIAQKFGISENTVDTSIRRSLAVLRKVFKQAALLLAGLLGV